MAGIPASISNLWPATELAPATDPRPRVAAQAVDSSGPRRLAGQPLFRSLVANERKRADRAGQPFLLLLVSFHKPEASTESITERDWTPITAAIAAATRESDIVGWWTQGTQLGVILPGAGAADGAASQNIAQRIRLQLQTRPERSASSVELTLHGNARQLRSGQPSLSPVEQLLYRLPEAQAASSRDGLKRTLDLVGSALLLLVLSPLFALIATLVKLTSQGPVFFRQTRMGQHAQPFTILKFRTMTAGSDPALHRRFVTKFITSSDKPRTADSAAPFKLAEDPRVTPIGRILRKTSLDELPQFWNVLIGEMSLVGPRPPIPYEVERYEPWHWGRILEAKPGITGLWQVNGRSRTTFDEMVRLDLRYVRTRSLWNDIKILFQTPGAVVSGKGAA